MKKFLENIKESVPIYSISMSKLSTGTSAPRENIFPFRHCKSVPPSARYLDNFLERAQNIASGDVGIKTIIMPFSYLPYITNKSFTKNEMHFKQLL